ncbi:nicotinamidase [Lichenicola sp.]|uniref:nicotinamidase n=1 Tax=Lichenicola sp. TaxID=2804529 RepID=UPI003AFF89BF
MPGGELPVADGHAVIPTINRLLDTRFRHAFATQDWHPPGHSSFASTHTNRQPNDAIPLPYGLQVLWPDHAIQGSPNAELHPDLDSHRIELIIRKGWRPELDSYSAFLENDRLTSTGLKGWLADRGARRLFLCGLAADFCVAWSAEDAVRAGFETFVIEDATRAIGMPRPDGGTSTEEARDRLQALGVTLLQSGDLL